MKDSDIIDLYWQRSEAAITATAEVYGNYCHRIAHSILGSPEDAEDASTIPGCMRGIPYRPIAPPGWPPIWANSPAISP